MKKTRSKRRETYKRKSQIVRRTTQRRWKMRVESSVRSHVRHGSDNRVRAKVAPCLASGIGESSLSRDGWIFFSKKINSFTLFPPIASTLTNGDAPVCLLLPFDGIIEAVLPSWLLPPSSELQLGQTSMFAPDVPFEPPKVQARPQDDGSG